MRRVALFGGSFDPVHVGHLAIAEAARRRARLDEVVFVPARRNPLKKQEPSVSAEDRYEMVRRALASAPGLRASRSEVDRPETSYTVETLRAFAHDDVALFFLLGVDALGDLVRWREPAEVLRLATLLAAKRPGAAEPDLAAIRALGGRIEFLDAPLVDLSSRELRAYARSGGSLRYLVPEAAWRYAAERGLYGQRPEGSN